MPATRRRYGGVGRRERIPALVAAGVIQAGFIAALLLGLRVPVSRASDTVARLIDIRLPPPPSKPPPKPIEHPRATKATTAPRAQKRAAADSRPAVPRSIVARPAPVRPSAGNGTASSGSAGSGNGGGSGGEGEGDGGTDLVQIAGAILPSDYPKDLRNRGIGGRVGVLFTVGANGRVTACSITRPSGVPELDALTCRLIRERFLYRPSTDSHGRPIADEVEGEHDWIAAERH